MPKQRLSEATEDYLLFRRSQSLAANTLKNDRASLVLFKASAGDLYVENISDRHVDEFMATRAGQVSPGTLAVNRSCLNQFFDWCRRTRRAPVNFDPMAGRRAPKAIQRERSRLHVSRFPAILDAAGARHPRDRAFVALCLYTCARTSEIEAMRLRDLDLDARELRVTIWKSRKEDLLPISEELDRELRRWLTFYAQEQGELQPDWYLTPARITYYALGQSEKGTVIRPKRRITHSARQIVKPALASVNFEVADRPDLKGEGAHTLRRSGARAWYDDLVAKGVHDDCIGLVQSLLHHKNRSQTEHYIGVTVERKRRNDTLKGQPMFGLPEVTVLPRRDVG